MIYLYALSVAVVSGTLAYVLFNRFWSLGNRSYMRVNVRLRKKITEVSQKDRRETLTTVVGSLTGLTLGLMVGAGTSSLIVIAFIGSIIGTVAAWFVRHAIGEARKTRMIRELAILYETIDFFTRGESQHYTIRQALRYAVAITPTIRPYVQSCINNWASGPHRALENFAKEVNMPEAETLASILIHAEMSGMSYASASISEGSQDLEDLRNSLVEMRVNNAPLYLVIYRGLPTAGLLGILLGGLIQKMSYMLKVYFNT